MAVGSGCIRTMEAAGICIVMMAAWQQWGSATNPEVAYGGSPCLPVRKPSHPRSLPVYAVPSSALALPPHLVPAQIWYCPLTCYSTAPSSSHLL